MTSESLVSTVYNSILEGDLISQNKVAGKILSSFIIVGLLTHLILKGQRSSHGQYGPATALIWGYTITIISIVCVVFLNNVGKKTTNIFKMIPIDILLTLLLMIWMISLNTNNLIRINKGNVSPAFYGYSSVSSWIIFAQIIFFFFTSIFRNLLQGSGSGEGKNINDDVKKILTKVTFINYLLLLLNSMFILAQQLILSNFSVDVL